MTGRVAFCVVALYDVHMIKKRWWLKSVEWCAIEDEFGYVGYEQVASLFRLEDDMVDAVIQKIVDSRRKSVKKLDADIAELRQKAGVAHSPAARRVLEAQAGLAEQRRARLQGELEALLAEQPELPGVGQAKPPAKR